MTTRCASSLQPSGERSSVRGTFSQKGPNHGTCLCERCGRGASFCSNGPVSARSKGTQPPIMPAAGAGRLRRAVRSGDWNSLEYAQAGRALLAQRAARRTRAQVLASFRGAPHRLLLPRSVIIKTMSAWFVSESRHGLLVLSSAEDARPFFAASGPGRENSVQRPAVLTLSSQASSLFHHERRRVGDRGAGPDAARRRPKHETVRACIP